MSDDSEDPFWIEGRPKPLSDNDKYWSIWSEVEPGYLKVMGIQLLRGRFFTPEDSESAPRVAVVDQDFTEKFFPGEDPIGKVFVDDYVGPTKIVGVVGHVKQWGLDDKLAIHAEFYLPFRQSRTNTCRAQLAAPQWCCDPPASHSALWTPSATKSSK